MGVPTVYEDIQEFDNDDRYAVAHNINDYDEDENDEDDDEFTTKDYSKKQNERNYYSSTNRNNQRPASNKNHHQKSNSVSEKSTSLWSNSGKFFQKSYQMESVEISGFFLLIRSKRAKNEKKITVQSL